MDVGKREDFWLEFMRIVNAEPHPEGSPRGRRVKGYIQYFISKYVPDVAMQQIPDMKAKAEYELRGPEGYIAWAEDLLAFMRAWEQAEEDKRFRNKVGWAAQKVEKGLTHARERVT